MPFRAVRRFEGYGYSNVFTYETVVFYDVDRSGVLQDEGVTFTIRNITTPQEIIDDFGNDGECFCSDLRLKQGRGHSQVHSRSHFLFLSSSLV